MARTARQRTAPHFFKVFFPHNSSQHLMIPPAFRKHMGGVAPGTKLTLKGPNGGACRVELVENSSGLCFWSGWNKFVVDHSLSLGDFLLFRYDGGRSFSVVVFDSSSCEKEGGGCQSEGVAASKALILSGDRAFLPTLNRRRKREGSQTVIGSSRKKKYAPLDQIMTEQSQGCVGRLTPGMSKSSTNVSNSSPPTNTLMPPLQCVVKCEASASGQISSNKNPVYSKEAGKSEWPFKFHPKPLAVVNTGETPRYGKVALQVQRLGPLISQRRPVTEEEIDKTVERAMSFKSDKPFATVVMQDSYVYNGLFMNMPWSFAKKRLPKSGKITLWDSDGEHWTVTFISYKNRGGLSAGWGKFSYAHNLEKDDICIFELIERDNLRVHFFRVVEELTPLIRKN